MRQRHHVGRFSAHLFSTSQEEEKNPGKSSTEFDLGRYAVVDAFRRADPTMRHQVSVMAGGRMAMSCGLGMIAPILPLVCEGVGLGVSGVGMLISTTALSQMLLNFQMGFIADTIGRRIPMVTGCVISAVGDFATSVAGTVPAITGARAGVGAGDAAFVASAGAYVADITEKMPDHRGLIMGTLSSLSMMAYAVGPVVGGALTSEFGVHMPFVASGSLAALCAVAFARLPETLDNRISVSAFASSFFKSKQSSGGGDQALDADSAKSTTKQPFFAGFLEMGKRPQLQSIFAIDAFGGISWGMYLTIVPLHTLYTFNVDITELGIALSLAAISGIGGSALGGWASDRFGRMRVIKTGACHLNVCSCPQLKVS